MRRLESGLVTLDIFQPSSDLRTKEAEVALGGIMADYFGREGMVLYRRIQNGLSFSTGLAQRTDANFFAAARRNYDLDNSADPEEFYLNQMRRAKHGVEYINEVLPELKQEVGLKNEVDLLPDSPSAQLRYLALPDGQIDPVMKWEIFRNLLFMHIEGVNSSRGRKYRLRTLISTFHDALSERLFEGVPGSGIKHELEGVFDNETNSLLSLHRGESDLKPGEHLKRIPFMTRTIRGVGDVLATARRKDNSAIKVIAKAALGDGVINVDTAVEDSIGMMFVTLGEEDNIDLLKDRVRTVIADKPLQILNGGCFRLVDVKPDDKFDGNRGQSTGINFQRDKFYFEGVPLPVEVFYMDRENYLRSILHVGEVNPLTGFLDGSAHGIYQPIRLKSVLPVTHPYSIYQISEDRFSDLIAREQANKANSLRQQYRAA